MSRQKEDGAPEGGPVAPSETRRPAARIQRQRTKGWRMPPDTVYVGRPSRWGNGFTPEMRDPLDRPLGRDRAVDLYEIATARFLDDGPPDEVEAWIAPLVGKNLTCWCALWLRCHTTFLLKAAAEWAEKRAAA